MWQLWIQNDNLQFEKVGPPKNTVDANLWLQVRGQHFGCDVRLRLAETERAAIFSPQTRWPGE